MLLEGSMLSGKMAGGGVGIAVKEELILMHCTLDMSEHVDSSELRKFAPLYVKTVEEWRIKCAELCEGHVVKKEKNNTKNKEPDARISSSQVKSGSDYSEQITSLCKNAAEAIRAGNNQLALESYASALSIFERHMPESQETKASIMANIATVNLKLLNIEAALDYLKGSLKIKESLPKSTPEQLNHIRAKIAKCEQLLPSSSYGSEIVSSDDKTKKSDPTSQQPLAELRPVQKIQVQSWGYSHNLTILHQQQIRTLYRWRKWLIPVRLDFFQPAAVLVKSSLQLSTPPCHVETLASTNTAGYSPDNPEKVLMPLSQ